MKSERLTLFHTLVEFLAEFFGSQRLSDRVHVRNELLVGLLGDLSGLLRVYLLLFYFSHLDLKLGACWEYNALFFSGQLSVSPR